MLIARTLAAVVLLGTVYVAILQLPHLLSHPFRFEALNGLLGASAKFPMWNHHIIGVTKIEVPPNLIVVLAQATATTMKILDI